MPHVSKNKLSNELEEKVLHNLFFVLAEINKTDGMEKFLLSLLSPTEQLMLAKRLTLFFLIKEGYSDSEIESMLHMTRMTISRFRYFIDSEGEGLHIAWDVLQDEKVKKEVRDLLNGLANYAVNPISTVKKHTLFKPT